MMKTSFFFSYNKKQLQSWTVFLSHMFLASLQILPRLCHFKNLQAGTSKRVQA